MTIHVGEITSDVRTTSPAGPATAEESASIWDERQRVAALLDRVARDHWRTATGPDDG